MTSPSALPERPVGHITEQEPGVYRLVLERTYPVPIERVWQTLVFTEIGALMLPLMRPLLDPDSLRFLELALELHPPADLAGYAAAMRERHGLARRWSLFQQRHPLVLAPVATEPAFRIGLDVDGADGARTSG